MDPMIELDRALSAALQVEPTPGFAARARARIAADTPARKWQTPALVAFASAVAAVIATSVWPSGSHSIASRDSLIRSGDILVISALPRAVESIAPLIALPATPKASLVTNVVISRSEMRALQRLFSGATVMPPAPAAASDALSIPALSIDPIPANSPGERQ